jgi:hypothetical protein
MSTGATLGNKTRTNRFLNLFRNSNKTTKKKSGKKTVARSSKPEDAVNFYDFLEGYGEEEQTKIIKNNTKESKEYKIILRKYIEFLYKYLGDHYCFVSGAFVIPDPKQTLYHILFKGHTSILNQGLLNLESHTLLKKQSLIQQQNKEHPHVTIDNNVYENWLTGELTFEMKCKCPCSEKYTTRPARNVKWYQFLGLDNELYIYLKLEDWGTVHPLHAAQAISKYGFGKSNESCRVARREDCKHDCDEPTNDCCNAVKPDDLGYSEYDIDYNGKKIIQEDYGRVGNEMFIPGEVSEYILKNIENNQLNITSANKNIVNIGIYSVVGGKYKDKKISRKTHKRYHKKNKKMRKRNSRK